MSPKNDFQRAVDRVASVFGIASTLGAATLPALPADAIAKMAGNSPDGHEATVSQNPSTAHAEALAQKGILIPGVNDHIAQRASSQQTQSANSIDINASFSAAPAPAPGMGTNERIAPIVIGGKIGAAVTDGLQNGSITLYSNDGKGNLTPITTFAAGNFPSAVTVVDYLGNGSQAVVWVEGQTSAGRLLAMPVDANGNPGQMVVLGAAAPNYLPTGVIGIIPPGGTVPDLMMTASLGNGGAFDGAWLYFQNQSSNSISFIQSGTGVVHGNPYDLARVNLDGQGGDDVAILSRADVVRSAVIPFTNIARGVFTEGTADSVGYDSRRITAVPQNGTTVEGIATADFQSQTASVIKNNTIPGGSLSLAPAVAYPVAGQPLSIVAAPLGSNGASIVTGNQANPGQTVTRLNQATGSYDFSERVDFPTTGNTQDLTVANFRDGELRTVAMTAGANVNVFNNKTADFSKGIATGEPMHPTAIVFGDLNHDGYLDQVASEVDSAGASWQVIRAGLPGGGFGPPNAVSDSPFNAERTIAKALDVDGDGNLDIILNGTDTEILYGNGDLTFTPSDPVSLPTNAIAIGQMDGAGGLDIVAASSSGSKIKVFLSTGARSFNPTAISTSLTGISGTPYLEIGHIFGSANLDAALTAGGKLYLLSGDGTGKLRVASAYPSGIALTTGATAQGIAIGNIYGSPRPNGPATDDLVIAEGGTVNKVHFLMNNGDGTFTDKGAYSAGVSPSKVHLVNLTNDPSGELQAVVINSSTNTINVLAGIRSGQITRYELGSGGTTPNDIALVDRDGDNYVDIIVANNDGSIAFEKNLKGQNTTGVGDYPHHHALGLELSPPAPNPSRGNTAFRFSLPEASEVKIAIYDVAGRLVRSVTEGSMPAGEHEARWDGLDSNGSHVAAGMYLVRVAAGDRAGERKILVLH